MPWHTVVPKQCAPSFRTHPKAVVEEPVNYGIDEAVGHGQPVDSREDGRSRAARLRLTFAVQLRVEIDDQGEDVQGQPTDSEQDHNYHQHLDNLGRNKPTIMMTY